MYPPYSPDLNPPDYHLFRSLQNSVNVVKLPLKEGSVFRPEIREFYNNGIMVLLEKWQMVIDPYDTYMIHF